MEKYTNYCTDEQTKRAYKLGAPIEKDEEITACFNYKIFNRILIDDGNEQPDVYCIPTTQQMIGWLRESRFIVFVHELNNNYEWVIESNYGLDRGEETSYEQAELAAIDTALDYLENGE